MNGKMKVLAGNSNPPLANAIAAYLGEPLTGCHVRRFADLEIFVEILENVRGRDVFVIQSTSYPANDNLMELLIMIDALRRASAQRITAVIPYFGYARQDRKPGPRSPISAKLVANLITRAGAVGFGGASAATGPGHSSRAGPEQYDAPVTAPPARRAIHRMRRRRRSGQKKPMLGVPHWRRRESTLCRRLRCSKIQDFRDSHDLT